MKTRSEEVFESFLTRNKLAFNKIKEDTSSRPDYSVHIGCIELVFEVKELVQDAKFGVVSDPLHPNLRSFSGTVGNHVRRTIHGSKKQIQYGAKLGLPSILLIYNSFDPLQMFGIDDLDFTSAMYGEFTMLVDTATRATTELFNGKNDYLQREKNTSFSAVGRLADRQGEPTVTLFENLYSKVRVPYDQLPPCFKVKRAEISSQPLSFA